MTIEYFRFLFNREYDVFYLTDRIMLMKKPYSIWFEDTDITVNFKSVNDMLKYEIDGATVEEMIKALDKPHTPQLSGSRGAKSGANGTFKFNHARGEGGKTGNGKALLPAQANVRIESKSLEGALAEFKRRHLDSDHEWAYEVDSNGYVHQYVEGDTSSVAISGSARLRRGESSMIIHNHPGGGAFSDSDLLSVSANRQEKGIIASGKNYDYKFEKGTHFKAAQFTKAVKTAVMSGKDYDDAVDKWLKKNQSKYGYKYSRTKN